MPKKMLFHLVLVAGVLVGSCLINGAAFAAGTGFCQQTSQNGGGLITTLSGSFTAGVDGDKPGIIMNAHPVVGNFYRQEFSLGNAEDLAEVLGLNESVSVPVGSFPRCLKTQETTPLETDLLEHKFYAAGVGNVLTIDANTGERSELVRITTH